MILGAVLWAATQSNATRHVGAPRAAVINISSSTLSVNRRQLRILVHALGARLAFTEIH
jgi:hypothetical protein